MAISDGVPILNMASLDRLLQTMAQANTAAFSVSTGVGVFISQPSTHGNALMLALPAAH